MDSLNIAFCSVVLSFGFSVFCGDGVAGFVIMVGEYVPLRLGVLSSIDTLSHKE